jgi:hypothetical protein
MARWIYNSFSKFRESKISRIKGQLRISSHLSNRWSTHNDIGENVSGSTPCQERSERSTSPMISWCSKTERVEVKQKLESSLRSWPPSVTMSLSRTTMETRHWTIS